MDKWQQYIRGKTSFVILDGKLYETGIGQSRFTWLDLASNEVQSDVGTKLIGKVPKKHSKELNNTGIKLTQISFNL